MAFDLSSSPAPSSGPRRALAVGVVQDTRERAVVEEHLQELVQLADTAGFEVVSTVTQERRSIDPATFIGSGKVEEIRQLAEDLEIEAVIFDDELSPAQGRNLEKLIGKPVTDRTGIILDIFAWRARSREARVQVELARLQYLLPRLTGLWSHFTRQRGGVGMRGEGETQLEMDRRMTKTRIAELRRELEEIRIQAIHRRQGRQDAYRVALVGYTNAGKSTLMNALTRADVLAENRLFATLDATMRSLELPSGDTVVLTDTVGFIRKLPPTLVASFRSTLDEVRDAHLLLHVVDLGHPAWDAQVEATQATLAELGVQERPTVMVFNQVDRPEARGQLPRIMAAFPGSVAISARTGEGLQTLLETIQTYHERERGDRWFRFGPEQHRAVSMLHGEANVREVLYEETGHTLVHARISEKELGRLQAACGHPFEVVQAPSD
jgi:GTP-binding protein HflX